MAQHIETIQAPTMHPLKHCPIPQTQLRSNNNNNNTNSIPAKNAHYLSSNANTASSKAPTTVPKLP